jgi:two-component system response regulator (stage 0 sporulation protein A)
MTEAEYFNSIFGSATKKSPDVFKTIDVKPGDSDLALEVTDILSNLGIPRNILGFNYLREAVILSYNDRTYINCITKLLYPKIAETYSTRPSRVERAIRHSIEVACNKNADGISSLVKRTITVLSDKPTNSEFLATIVDSLWLRKNNDPV